MKRNRLFLVMLSIAMLSATSVSAQVTATAKKNATAQSDTTQKESFGDRFVRLGKKAVKEMERTANNIGDAIGFEDRVDAGKGTADSVKIDGAWYMPLYTVNLYTGSDLDIYRSACRSAFAKAYPGVEIVNVVVPQKEWLSDTYKKNNKVTGYVQTLYCYVLGKDGSDGYVNARFMFQRTKEVGKTYQHVADRWPLWENTDVIPRASYEKLAAKTDGNN